MKTTIHKGRDGWQANTNVPLKAPYFLRVSTSKRSGGELVTTATRMKDEGNGGTSFIMFQDFNQTVLRRKIRVTEKAVQEQHAHALANINLVQAACERHYLKEPG